MRVHWKIWFLGGAGGGGGQEKPILRGGLHKKGRAWTVCRFKEGRFGKKEEGGVFERGWYPNAHDEQQFFLIYFITTFLKQYSHMLK